VLIRGDVTFVRQDFSLQLPARPGDIPDVVRPRLPLNTVRFDYVVRRRALTPGEAARRRAEAKGRPSYPQRDAALFALRELTGLDAGDSTEAWQKAFPYADTDVQAEALVNDLVRATPLERSFLLARLELYEGALYTRGLARAVQRLDGELRAKCRTALVARLARAKPTTLRAHLKDLSPEVRQAAAVACARREERAFVPDLIALLDDREPETARVALAGLKGLTGQDLDGPAAWRAWWQKQGEAAAER
jgi:hypothetical protein